METSVGSDGPLGSVETDASGQLQSTIGLSLCNSVALYDDQPFSIQNANTMFLCFRGLMYCLNNQEQSFYQVVEANKLLGDFLQQRLGLDCTQEDVEHCWGVLQVSTWLNSR